MKAVVGLGHFCILLPELHLGAHSTLVHQFHKNASRGLPIPRSEAWLACGHGFQCLGLGSTPSLGETQGKRETSGPRKHKDTAGGTPVQRWPSNHKGSTRPSCSPALFHFSNLGTGIESTGHVGCRGEQARLYRPFWKQFSELCISSEYISTEQMARTPTGSDSWEKPWPGNTAPHANAV